MVVVRGVCVCQCCMYQYLMCAAASVKYDTRPQAFVGHVGKTKKQYNKTLEYIFWKLQLI